MRREYPEGAITDKDVIGLVKNAQAMAKRFPELDMLEIGAWKGKSAVVIAKELKEAKANIKLYSIDPHEGFKDYNRQYCSPTYEAFCDNMKEYEVSHIVTCIRKKAEDVKWTRLISLLFIDGLHGYKDIKHDFEKFEPHVVVGGCIAIHDYWGSFWRDVKEYILKEVLLMGIRPNKPQKRFNITARYGSTLYLEKKHG